jgi:hypothetical protein
VDVLQIIMYLIVLLMQLVYADFLNLCTTVRLCLSKKCRVEAASDTTLLILYVNYILPQHVSAALYDRHQVVVQANRKEVRFIGEASLYKQ